ncbi:zinc-binding dehydrogenase [Streptomyces sp. NBS 14/10]|uniref:zinc-binding dehydrogenase n=1 Tax=Streptomyces sp. NBS 14/10 TaxID=1945643 RepID=UPI00211B2D27|nr:zinc-binding dehydrogenase [Streptomyces sp. NBS 14/10]
MKSAACPIAGVRPPSPDSAHGEIDVLRVEDLRRRLGGALARLAARGELEVPIARTYPLDQVRDTFRELEQGHTHGKIVLRP